MDDSKSKAMNWTDNIYNSIEGIVPDIDDIQDTFKYVENRVTSVGGSLKKFYSGVVLEFFPLSVEAEAESTVTEPEQNSASSADPVEHEAKSTEPEEEEDSAFELEEAKEEEEKEEEEESCDSEDNNTQCEEEVNIESAFYSLMINVSEPSSTDGELTDEKSNASENDSSVISTSVECSSSGSGSEILTVFDSASSRIITRSLSDVSSLCPSPFELSRLASDSTKETNNGEVDETRDLSLESNCSSLCLSPFELSRLASDSIKETNNGVVVETRDLSLESNDDSGVETMEAISLQNDDDEEKPKLEDSCVMVDDMALYAVSRRAQRLGSYKNKLREIFASKKRLVKEYKQLAIWYGDASIEPTSSSWNSQGSHSCDSDWEIL